MQLDPGSAPDVLTLFGTVGSWWGPADKALCEGSESWQDTLPFT